MNFQKLLKDYFLTNKYSPILAENIVVKKVLFIGLVFPESVSTAAGSRMMQLLTLFKQYRYALFFAGTASENTHSDNLEALAVNKTIIALNNSSFDDFIVKLQPDVVVFDRFISEEQFGWRVAEHCPKALRILDTEDLHCLRKVRHQAIKRHEAFEMKDLLSADIAKREIASIYRCDLSLIISTYEMKLLTVVFKVGQSLLYHLPFLLDTIHDKEVENFIPFEERQHFMSIGNFLHAPNVDAVLYLKRVIWSFIHKQLPSAQLHIYGAYCTPQIRGLHNEKEGFFVKGFVKDAKQVVSKAKVCLAPLRFGAGIKGKLIEAMQYGTPSITTSIGAEGMHAEMPWNGFIEDAPEKIAQKAVKLYSDKSVWEKCQQNGIAIVNRYYDKKKLSEPFFKHIEKLKTTIEEHRNLNFTGAMLQHHLLQSTKYLSKWIEAKNK